MEVLLRLLVEHILGNTVTVVHLRTPAELTIRKIIQLVYYH